MHEPGPSSFGRYLRAARIGFHWARDQAAFIRMSEAWTEAYRIEFCSADNLPKRPTLYPHILWWEEDNGAQLLAASPFLSAWRAPTGLFFEVTYVNEVGLEVPLEEQPPWARVAPWAQRH